MFYILTWLFFVLADLLTHFMVFHLILFSNADTLGSGCLVKFVEVVGVTLVSLLQNWFISLPQNLILLS